MAKRPTTDGRVAELEDLLRQRDDRIKELTAERDEERERVDEMREHVEDARAMIDNWIEAFDMQLDDDGNWSYAEWLDDAEAMIERYRDLLAEWNRAVGLFNSVAARRNVGRPLAAAPAQVAEVLRLRAAGGSLRGIAGDTGLSLATVRTIVDRKAGTDRTTRKHYERIHVDRAEAKRSRARKRTRDGIPKRIGEVLARGQELVKAARSRDRTR